MENLKIKSIYHFNKNEIEYLNQKYNTAKIIAVCVLKKAKFTLFDNGNVSITYTWMDRGNCVTMEFTYDSDDESNENSAAFNILNAVLHYAESPAAPTMNDLYQQLHKDGMVKKFFEAFFDHDDIDDYSLELTILRASVDDTDKLLN